MVEKVKDGNCIHGARWILYKNINDEEEYMDVAMPFTMKKGKPVKLCDCNRKAPKFETSIEKCLCGHKFSEHEDIEEGGLQCDVEDCHCKEFKTWYPDDNNDNWNNSRR